MNRVGESEVDFLYVVVSYTAEKGQVIRPGLSLVQAYHLIARLGRGAIFRSEGMSVYARPVYPLLPESQEHHISRSARSPLTVHPQGRVA